jgi:hypothetical protein
MAFKYFLIVCTERVEILFRSKVSADEDFEPVAVERLLTVVVDDVGFLKQICSRAKLEQGKIVKHKITEKYK